MTGDLRARVLRLLERLEHSVYCANPMVCPDCEWPLYLEAKRELAAVMDALRKPERVVPQPPPRYDAVYAEGIRDLEEKG